MGACKLEVGCTIYHVSSGSHVEGVRPTWVVVRELCILFACASLCALMQWS